MLPSLNESKRRSLIPLAGLALAAYYLLVFVPLGHHADDLDLPLRKAWQKLAGALGQTNATTLDFVRLTNQLEAARKANAILTKARKEAAARLELSSEVRAKMNAPFELVEYENARGKKMDELSQLAKQQQVTLEPAVFAGFPEQTADVEQPGLLWPALSLINGLLTAAIQSKVAVIHFLDAPLTLTNVPGSNAAWRLDEIPLQIEFTGPAASLARLIESLPLRPEELHAAGLPEAPPDKMPLFLDRLVIKKQSPDKPDEIRASLRVVGFVPKE
jgi:hypothetical protein